MRFFVLIPALAIFSSLAALSACSSVPENPTMLINTVPNGAQLTFDSGFICTSPCKVIVRRPMRVTAAKAGYIAQDNLLEWSRAEQVTWTLRLAAPTIDVDEESLPDLSQ